MFLMEPAWNPATEAQAIGRVSRLGMTHKIKVVRYVLAGTVEERIVTVKTAKQQAEQDVFSMLQQEDVPHDLGHNISKMKTQQQNQNLTRFCDLLGVDEAETRVRLQRKIDEEYGKFPVHKQGHQRSKKVKQASKDAAKRRQIAPKQRNRRGSWVLAVST